MGFRTVSFSKFGISDQYGSFHTTTYKPVMINVVIKLL